MSDLNSVKGNGGVDYIKLREELVSSVNRIANDSEEKADAKEATNITDLDSVNAYLENFQTNKEGEVSPIVSIFQEIEKADKNKDGKVNYDELHNAGFINTVFQKFESLFSYLENLYDEKKIRLLAMEGLIKRI